MTEPKSPACTACGVEWFYHGGMPHEFMPPDVAEAMDAAAVLRERAEKAEDAAGRLGEDLLAARRERDKARRVAKVLAGPAKHLKVLGHDLTADELKAIDTALAYPGREP